MICFRVILFRLNNGEKRITHKYFFEGSNGAIRSSYCNTARQRAVIMAAEFMRVNYDQKDIFLYGSSLYSSNFYFKL